MKIKPKHIQRFEAFIENSKDPNTNNTEQTKGAKKAAPADENEETQSDDEKESDRVDELKQFYSRINKNYSKLWKSTI